MEKSVLAAFIFGSIAVVAVCGFLYGLLIYNNQQNIKRDEFIATHCKILTKQETAFGEQYACK